MKSSGWGNEDGETAAERERLKKLTTVVEMEVEMLQKLRKMPRQGRIAEANQRWGQEAVRNPKHWQSPFQTGKKRGEIDPEEVLTASNQTPFLNNPRMDWLKELKERWGWGGTGEGTPHIGKAQRCKSRHGLSIV